MIGNAIALFRARKNPAVAATLARDMLVDGALERASFPLSIAKFWLSVGIFICAILASLILWGAAVTHEWLALPAALPLGLIYACVRIWRGMDAGKAKVVALAKAQVLVAQSKMQDKILKRSPIITDTDNAVP